MKRRDKLPKLVIARGTKVPQARRPSRTNLVCMKCFLLLLLFFFVLGRVPAVEGEEGHRTVSPGAYSSAIDFTPNGPGFAVPRAGVRVIQLLQAIS